MKLYIVGIGPGNYENMTVRADRALQESQVIVGYPVYVDLVKDRYPDKQYAAFFCRLFTFIPLTFA